MEGQAAAPRLDELDVARDQARVAVVGINDQHGPLTVGIGDGAADRSDAGAGAKGVKRRHELGAAVQVEHAVTVDLKVIIREQGAGATVSQTERAVVDRGGAGVELESVEMEIAAQVLGEAGAAGDTRGDREGLTVGDVEETFGPERDERNGQRGGRAGTVDEDRAGRERERAGVQTAETAN